MTALQACTFKYFIELYRSKPTIISLSLVGMPAAAKKMVSLEAVYSLFATLHLKPDDAIFTADEVIATQRIPKLREL